MSFGIYFLILFLKQTISEVALTPPRGWNSYDSYTWTLNETQAIQNLNGMIKYLKSSNYTYFVIDYWWYRDINDFSKIYIDQYGRPLPDPNRYPHSYLSNGTCTGFQWISEQVHNAGLKFGVHLMRGISDAAVNANSNILGTDGIKADDIVNESEKCPWDNQFLGINMSANGAQQFYDSIYSQMASWGVDFIKNDCVYGSNFLLDNIQSVSKSINKVKNETGIEIVYSLSPGDYQPPSEHAQYIYNITNMYRITNDDWDNWDDLIKHFEVSAEHAKAGYYGKNGLNGLSWPDNDMLPLGYITEPGHSGPPYHYTYLKQGQQRIQMTLWCMTRSPLMFGGATWALNNDTFTLNLITNKYCLSVNDNSINNNEIQAIYNRSTSMRESSVWSAQQNNDYFVAMFNLLNIRNTIEIGFNDIGISGNSCQAINVWTGDTMQVSKSISMTVSSEDCVFLFLYNCQ